jgi:adenine-specific DNA glycosylase
MFLIEQRPPRGRWASLWQFVTAECTGGASRVTSATVRAAVAGDAVVASASPQLLGIVEHAITHRRYRFEVYLCDVRRSKPARNSRKSPQRPRCWVELRDLQRFPLPRPHLRIAQMLQEPSAFRGIQ